MIWNRLGRPARFLMVATAVACWIPCVPVAAAGMPLVQTPSEPQNLMATLEGTSVRLTWTAPTQLPGESPITGYRIQWFYRPHLTEWTVLVPNTGNPAPTYTHQNPPRGTTVYYRVAAINAAGLEGTYSAYDEVTTTGSTGTPSEPLNLTATIVGSIATLTWDAPASTNVSPITRYEIHVSADGGGAWTFVAQPVAPTTTYVGPVTVGVVSTTFRVRAVNANGAGIPAFKTVTTGSTGTPSAPLNLRAVAAGPTIIDLDWDAPASPGGSAIIDYQVEMSANGGASWTLLTTTGLTATAFQHTSLPAGVTRHYRVRARNANGFGPWTSPESATTSAGTPPEPPRALTATAVGSSAIELSWSAPLVSGSSAIIGYRIEWSSTQTGVWSDLVANTGNTRTTNEDTGLAPGTTRYYRVSAINSYATGAPSNIDGALTLRVPDAPGRLTAEARGMSAIELGWTRPSSSGTAAVTGYQIEWSSTRTGRWQSLVANTRSTTTRHTDDSLSPGTTRYYRVAAISGAGTSDWSNVDGATTDDLTVPGAPSGLSATPRGSTQISLAWRPPTSTGGTPITGYRIERSRTGNSPWVPLVANTGSTLTTYPDEGLTPGTTWFYRVAAINAEGSGRTYSNVARGTTNAARPGQPQNLRARGAGPMSIDLDWEAPSSDGGARITGYSIQVWGPNDRTWRTIRDNTRSVETTFTHTGLDPGTVYRYRVAAINRVDRGDWSGPASDDTYAGIPSAPVNLTAEADGTSQIDLSWSAPRNTGGAPVLGYRIEVSNDGRGSWRTIRRDTGSTSTRFSHTGLPPATTRYYRVYALNEAGIGPASNVARETTDATSPGRPRNLAAQADGTSEIDLSWQAPATDGGAPVTGYQIEVFEDGTWRHLVANTRNTRTNYSDTGLEPASTRSYRVSAINRIGVSGASRAASATTDATVPDAPTGLLATATTPTQIDLTWVAPAYDGGAPVTGYRIEVSETGAAWIDLWPDTESTGTTFSHTGLLPGSSRSYRVSAINRAGTGAASGVASAATDDPVQRAGRLNTRVLPHVAAAMTSSTVSAIARRVDAVANGMGMERRMDTGGLFSMAGSLSAPGAGGAGLGGNGRAGLSSLFGGTAFQMPLGASDAPQQTSGGARMASWGAGEYHYLGEPGASALDWSGNMVSAHLGADVRIGPDILAGLAASHSQGTFDFTDKTGASPVTGTYGTVVTSVNPYVAWFTGRRGDAVWASGGFGWGDIEVEDEREALRTSPAQTMTGAAGGSYQLFESGSGGVRFKAEGWAGRVSVDGGERIDSVTLDMQRAKLALEWTQGFRTETGHEVAFVLEGGMRYDNGDGMNGTGAEVGGGLRYTNAGLGVSAEGRGRLLLSGRDGYEEWGVGGMIQIDPATRDQGLSVRLSPSYGDAASGLNQLWERGVSGVVGDRDLGARTSLNSEIAYGLAGFRGTPYSGFYMSESGVRAFSSGLRYELGSGVGLRIEGTRRESTLGAAEHTVGIRGRLRFR